MALNQNCANKSVDCLKVNKPGIESNRDRRPASWWSRFPWIESSKHTPPNDIWVMMADAISDQWPRNNQLACNAPPNHSSRAHTGPNWGGQGGVSKKRWCTAIWLAIQTVVINFTTSGLSFRGRRSTSSGTNHAIPCPPSSSSAQEAEAEEEESLHRVSAAVGSAKWNCFVQFHSKSKPHPRKCSFQGSSSSSSAQ